MLKLLLLIGVLLGLAAWYVLPPAFRDDGGPRPDAPAHPAPGRGDGGE